MWGVYALPGLKLWPPSGGHAAIMTTFKASAPQSSPLHAPVLQEDRDTARQMFADVKGTEHEQPFRDIYNKHPNKLDHHGAFQAFMEEARELFVAHHLALPGTSDTLAVMPSAQTPEPAVPETPTPEEAHGGTAGGDPLAEAEGATVLAEQEGEGSPEEAEDAPEVRGGEGAEPELADEHEASVDAPDEEAAETDDDDAGTEDAASPPSGLAAQTANAPMPATSSGLLAQLAGMLADGGQLTLQLMRVGDQLTVGILPKPHPGEQGPQALIVTNTPEWLDHHLVSAMQPYAQARQDAFSVCAAAATRQQAANKKAAAAPAPKTPAPASKPGPKTFKLTLAAEEGTTLTAKQDGKDVPISLGENTIKQGNLEVVATHDVFGETKKTFAMWADKTYDFREQQGGRVTIKVTPDTAALTAVQGERRIPFHAETLLPAGSWTIEAEAAEHDMATQKIHVKAGKPQDVELTLKLRDMTLLF